MTQSFIKSGKYNWPKAINVEKGAYYFISYSHRNSVMMCHDLSILATYEAPFWYDDGMVPGEDWKEKAQAAMSHPNCIGVIFFVTKASLQSFPVFEELKMALELSAKKSHFSIFSVNHQGKPISKWASEGAIPEEYQSIYSTTFPDNTIYISRKKTIASTEHIPLLLDVFNNAGLLKSKYKSILERSAFTIKPYKDAHMIASYRGEASNVIIPNTIDGKKIIAIGPDAFISCKNIRSIKIEEGIVEIMDNAFEGCVNVKAISFPYSLEYVGNECFKGCHKLTSATFFHNLKSLGDYVFYQCFNLQEVDFGQSPVNIGYAAFSQCIKLENLRLSPNTVSIGSYAFGGCAFKTLDVPPSTKQLGTDCCVCNPNLTHISLYSTTLPEELPSELGNLCPYFTHISVPYKMPEENINALSRLKPVRQRLDVVKNFINDEKGFFWDAIDGAEEYSIVIDNKQFFTTDCKLNFDFNKKSYRIAFSAHSRKANIEDSKTFFTYQVKKAEVEKGFLVGGSFLDGKVVAKSPVIGIGEKAFYNDLSITQVDFDGGRILDGAFSVCLNLERLTLNGETQVGNFAFNRCTKLAHIDWKQITQLGEGCFEGCSEFDSIHLSKKIKVIPKRAFRRCINVRNITFDGEPIEMQDDCLRGCMSIEKLVLPNSIERIGAHAISYISIKHITLPSNLTYFDQTNLQSCSYLSQIAIKNNPTFSIIQHALVKDNQALLRFPPAKKIKRVVVPECITAIEKGAFQDNSYVETLSTCNVHIIRERAFFASASLTQVTLSSEIEKIEAEAFAHCEHLNKVIIKGNKPIEIAQNAFDDNGALTIVLSKERANTLAQAKLLNCKIKIEVQDV